MNVADDLWLQFCLPESSGALGIALAPSAYIASAVGTRNLQNQILHFNTLITDDNLESCIRTWCATYGKPIPDQSSSARQKTWDKPVTEREYTELLHRHTDNHDRARLLAAAAKHSADWLHAIPITSCGLRLDDEAVQIAVGLRLGADICQPHSCTCGTLVNVRGSHALSCKRSSGRLIRHNHLNHSLNIL